MTHWVTLPSSLLEEMTMQAEVTPLTPILLLEPNEEGQDIRVPTPEDVKIELLSGVTFVFKPEFQEWLDEQAYTVVNRYDDNGIYIGFDTADIALHFKLMFAGY